MGNTRAVTYRRGAVERTTEALELFMQKHPNYLLWFAIGFVALALLYIITGSSGDDAEQPQAPTVASAMALANNEDAIAVMVPEKESPLSRDPSFSQEIAQQKIHVTVQSGDSLGKILGNQGFTAQEIHDIAAGIKKEDGHVTIFPGEVFEFIKDPETGVITEFNTETPAHKTLRVARVEEGFACELADKATETEEMFKTGTINNSLFADASKAGLSDRTIMELAQLFQWEIDFALDIRQGDSFKVIYDDIYMDNKRLRAGPILAAEFVNGSRTLRGYRYEHEDGTVGYYTEDGESLKKAFLKAPVDFARISSRFQLARKHPVLHKIRAHKGVDYAAARGTPIKATGRGRVSFMGWKGGYGRTVIVQHNAQHSTLYAHMNSFAKGLKQGQRVTQGQVIGAIGSTGLATGPHLHYEFRLNGTQVDPLKVKFPNAESLAGSDKQKFLKQIAAHKLALVSGDSSQLAANASHHESNLQ
ncbi:MAG TPA: peptidase M23 [Gammaproteobacteria bacterium]|nr:peptidase M23 [Gammaproteobacteria bacterium]